jgi:hypothetical protein
MLFSFDTFESLDYDGAQLGGIMTIRQPRFPFATKSS